MGLRRLSETWNHGRATWWLVGLLFLGLGLRVWGVTYHSFWLDEAVSVYLARSSPGEIIRRAMALELDPHPPLYYLVLHYWMALWGQGEVPVRALSVVAGTLLIPLVYILARPLGGRAAFLAASFSAINPFLVWYSQEARMYALLGVLCLASSWAYLEALRNQRTIWWIVYAVLSLASLYTHLYGIFVLVAQILYFLFFWRRFRASWLRALAAWASVLFLWSPWAWRAWTVSRGFPGARPFLDPLTMLRELAYAFSLRWVPPERSWAIYVAVGGLGLLSILGVMGTLLSKASSHEDGTSNQKRELTLFWLIYLISPLLLVYLVSLRATIFGTQYFLALAPASYILVALGVDWLAQFRVLWGAVAKVFAVAVFALGLSYVWSPLYPKEDWRAAARYVQSHQAQGDAIVLHVNYVRIAFDYYYSGLAPQFAPFGDKVSASELDAALSALGGFGTVWLVESHTEDLDPQRLVEGWLGERYPLVTEQYPASVTVKGYAPLYRLSALPRGVRGVEADFSNVIRLLGYQVDGSAFSPRDNTYHPPSGWIHVTLYWEALSRPRQDYWATVRLVDGAYQVWGGQLDRPEGTMRFYPPSAWQTGEIIRDDYDINLNPATPPGEYKLEVSLYSPDGERLEVRQQGQESDRLLLESVQILP